MLEIKYSKIAFPEPVNETEYIQMQNINTWQKWSKPLYYKLKLAIKIKFNDFVWYNYLNIDQPILTKCFIKGCKYSNMEIINGTMEKGYDEWAEGLRGACSGGPIEIIQLMIDKIKLENLARTSTNHYSNKCQLIPYNIGFSAACKAGRLNVAKLMIENGANDWGWAIISVCSASLKVDIQILFDIIRLIVSNKEYNHDHHSINNNVEFNWNEAMHNACRKGNLEIVQLMIEMGADEFRRGLRFAAYKENNTKIINLMIYMEQDNQSIDIAFKKACKKRKYN